MAKGTKLGAKAAEMISLAKNSTKARILANVEKWGSKVDKILAKSNNVIGKFGEKLLEIPESQLVFVKRQLPLREVWAQCLPLPSALRVRLYVM